MCRVFLPKKTPRETARPLGLFLQLRDASWVTKIFGIAAFLALRLSGAPCLTKYKAREKPKRKALPSSSLVLPGVQTTAFEKSTKGLEKKASSWFCLSFFFFFSGFISKCLSFFFYVIVFYKYFFGAS